MRWFESSRPSQEEPSRFRHEALKARQSASASIIESDGNPDYMVAIRVFCRPDRVAGKFAGKGCTRTIAMSPECRLWCDFEIEFANGGSLRGQDFCLDRIDADLTEDALGARIIADLRLRDVMRIAILSKRIVEEPRKGGASIQPAGRSKVRRIDLSHIIEAGMVTYRGLPAPIICDHLSRIESRQIYLPGTEFQIDRIDMVGNTGTYLDTPYHRYADGYDLADLPLDIVSGCPGIVVRATNAIERAIDETIFAGLDLRGKAVLIHTGWDAHWRTDRYFEGHPYLTEEAAIYLRDQGVRLVGIDSLNIDDISAGIRPVHTVLLGAGIPIVEHMTNLQALPREGFQFWAVPPKVSKVGTFPVRAHAMVEEPPEACCK